MLVKVFFNPLVFEKWVKMPALHRSIRKNLPALDLTHAHIESVSKLWHLSVKHTQDKELKETLLAICKSIHKNSVKKGRIHWEIATIILNECPE